MSPQASRPRRPSRVSSEQAAVVFAERVFEGESLAVHAKDPTTESVPLRPPKDVAAELHEGTGRWTCDARVPRI